MSNITTTGSLRVAAMPAMARQSSAGAFQGFSVFQPTLGAVLQWLPAIGTPELDDLVHAFLPGPVSIQDKRAHISMDFFEFARQTGNSFKFYPVPAAFASPAAPSPASSSGVYDSGYASSYDASPVVPTASWSQPSTSFVPVSFDEPQSTKALAPKANKTKASPASSTKAVADFAHHPGMRIMTKDGRDVTNSASRGCKTKEQRDHAHLMRIIKACDECRKKKIRCDPSHRKRTASQASSTQSEPKPAKKVKTAKTPAGPPPAQPQDAAIVLDDTVAEAFTAFDAVPQFAAADFVADELFDIDQFLDLDQYSNVFFDDSFTYAPPTPSFYQTSPSQLTTPLTSSSSQSPDASFQTNPVISTTEAPLPYLNPDLVHGTNYADFNLYSPSSSDSFLEEESQLLYRQLVPQGDQLQSQSSQATDRLAHVQHNQASRVQSSVSPQPEQSCPSPLLMTEDATNQSSPIGQGWTQYHSPGLEVYGEEEQPGLESRYVHRRQPNTSQHAQGSLGSLVWGQSNPRGEMADGVVAGNPEHAPRSRDRRLTRQPSGLVTSSTARGHGMSDTTASAEGVTCGSQSTINSTEAYHPTAGRGEAPLSSRLSVTMANHKSTTVSLSRQAIGLNPHSFSLGDRDERHDSNMVGVGRLAVGRASSGVDGVSQGQGRSWIGVEDSRTTMFAVLLGLLTSIVPMRRTPAGKNAVDGRPLAPPTATLLPQLAALGLVSLLVASAMHLQYPGKALELLNILAYASISLAVSTTVDGSARFRSEPSSSSSAGATPPTPQGTTIDKVVKSTIQAVGQRVEGLRSAISQRVSSFAARICVSGMVPLGSSVRLR